MDGHFVLYHDGDVAKAWTAYCDDIAGAASEYLTLDTPNVFVDNSQSFFPPMKPDKITTFSRVRVDPLTLRVNVTDLKFAVQTGDLTDADPISGGDDRAYATVGSCKANHGQGSQGTGTVDLRGTPFRVSDTFGRWGYYASDPVSSFSQDGQVVDLIGDGQCGWTGPLARAAFYGDPGWGEGPDLTQDPEWSLQLAFLP